MNHRIMLLLWLIPIGIWAQSKEERKLQAHYCSGNYAKGIKYSQKLISSENKEAYPYLFHSLFLQRQFQYKNGKINLENIRQSYLTIRKGKKADVMVRTFSHENPWYDSLLFNYHYLCENLILANHKTEAKAIATKLAEEFGDTLEAYYVFYPKPKSDEEVLYTPSTYAGKKFADSLIFLACQYQQKPYKYGADGPESFDCSGFVQFVFAHFGIKLPHNAHMISQLGKPIPPEELQKGDLIFFGTSRAYHVAISVTGDSGTPKIIHCVSRGVIVDDFGKESYWGKQPVYKVVRMN